MSHAVNIGRRHFPLNAAFQNGPNSGKDVFMPLDWIIGGPQYAGRGWMMLMGCLAAGRAISLPTSAVGGVKALTRYTGAYDLMGQTINVSLKGAALVAVVGGQPPMDLVPTLSGDFTLKQLQVVSIHFVMDDKGMAASFELRQPGTVLTAKRKQ